MPASNPIPADRAGPSHVRNDSGSMEDPMPQRPKKGKGTPPPFFVLYKKQNNNKENALI